MTASVSRRAYAKITLFLRITGKKATHHDIEALQQSINLFDEVTLCKRSDKEITSDFAGDNSLVVLKKLAETFSLGGMQLSIRKNIPIGGGLGGSSADAAAAALACADLWGLNPAKVKKTVAPLFGDLAFQMMGGTALARGFGDDVEPLPPLPHRAVLLAFPNKGVSTAEAYALSDTLNKGRGSALSLYWAIARGEKADQHYLNDLLPAATLLNEEIASALEAMRDENALLTGMSGSGSTLFSLYARLEDAEKKAESLSLPTLVTETVADIR